MNYSSQKAFPLEHSTSNFMPQLFENESLSNSQYNPWEFQPSPSHLHGYDQASEIYPLRPAEGGLDLSASPDNSEYHNCFTQDFLTQIHQSGVESLAKPGGARTHPSSSPLAAESLSCTHSGGPLSADVVLSSKVKSAQHGRGKRKPFQPSMREKVKRVRSQGACVRCRIYKETVCEPF